VIGDWTARQITGQVFDHIRRVAFAVGWALDENISVDRFELVQPLAPLIRIVQKCDRASDLDLALVDQSFQASEVVFSKLAAQFNIVGQVRFLAATMLGVLGDVPAVAFSRRARSGNQGVNVRMMIKLLVPSV